MAEKMYYQRNINEYYNYMLGVLLLPFLAYVLFLFYYLFIDLTRATLCLFELKKK